MTSLFGRLLPFSKRPRRVEDLFTEVVARLFERRPDLCVDWLRENDFISPENISTAEEQHALPNPVKEFPDHAVWGHQW